MLDAGCGTGRHAAALAGLGHRIELVDASPQLLAQAQRRTPGARAHLLDLVDLDLGRRFHAVTCRGVLNDLVEDGERQRVLEVLPAFCSRPEFLSWTCAKRTRAGSGQMG